MMKYLMLMVTFISITACSSVQHAGSPNMRLAMPNIVAEPLEIEVMSGKEIKGTAQCTNMLFGLFTNEPNKLMFGPELIETEGNFAPVACTAGALYNAITEAKADTILIPRYSLEGSKFLCIPFINVCLYNKSEVTITGFAGYYADKVKKMPLEVSNEVKKHLAVKNKYINLF